MCAAPNPTLVLKTLRKSSFLSPKRISLVSDYRSLIYTESKTWDPSTEMD